MTDKPLSPRHQRFVSEYLRDGNATQARFSARGAQSCASRLLGKPHIEAALAAGRQRIAQSLEVTVERVAQEYARITFAPIEVDLDHGKALQMTRLKLQALAAASPPLAEPQPLQTMASPGPGDLSPDMRMVPVAAVAKPLQNMARPEPQDVLSDESVVLP